ncbi:MAG: HEPN domain-containing protein [Cyanobacteria bacterium J06648_1]
MTKNKLTFPEFEEKGIWFLPNNPENEIVGILKFSPDLNTELELMGSLFAEPENQSETEIFERALGKKEVPIVLGILSNGKKVTLYKNLVFGEGIGKALTETKCYPTFIIKGIHFSTVEDIKFDSLSFHYSHLESWLRIQNIQVSMIPDSNKKRIEALNVSYRPLEKTKLCSIDDFELYLRDIELNPTPLHFASVFRDHISNIEVSENKRFELTANTHKIIEEFLNTLDNIQSFLVFSMGQSVQITTLETKIKEKKTRPKSKDSRKELMDFMNSTKNNDDKIIFQNSYLRVSQNPNAEKVELEEYEETIPVQIYFQTSNSDLSDKFNHNKVLIWYPDIEQNFDKVFSHWNSNRKKIKSVINLYLGLYYIPKRYLSERFLNIAQAIEAFHRIIYGGRYIDKQEYHDGIYQELLEAINSNANKHNLSSEFKESLKQRLSYLYEFSLRKRLKELVRTHKDCFPTYYLQIKQLQNNFIGTVVTVRNKLTHLDENFTVSSLIDYRELDRLRDLLEALLRICLMNLLEIDKEVIKHSIDYTLKR